MTRLVRSAAFVVDLRNALRTSEENWGRDGRARYALLVTRALQDLADAPDRHGVGEVPGRPEVFGYHLRHSRDAVPAVHRVRRPRHVVFFRIGDGRPVVRLLRLLHDRMLPNLWMVVDEDIP